MSAIFSSIALNFLGIYPSLKPHIIGNCLAIWQGFPVITYIQVKSGHGSAILNLIRSKQVFPVVTHIEGKSGRLFEIDQVEFFHGISLPETTHFFQY